MEKISGLIVCILMLVIAGCASQDIDDGNKNIEDKETTKMEKTSDKVDAIRVYESKKLQVIDGFGASAAWWAQSVGGWSEPNLTKIMDLLFDQEKGIGLSMVRYNLGGGEGGKIEDPWRSAHTLEIEPGVFDVKEDANALKVIREAKDRGVETIIAFANTPPARLTKSGMVFGTEKGSSNLSPDNYEAYSHYLIGAVEALRADGIPIDYVSPINEPQWDWVEGSGQEGCHYSIEEGVAMVKVLDETIKAQGIDLKISAMEAGEWKDAYDYAEALFADEALNQSLDHFAGHSYWSSSTNKNIFAKQFEPYRKDKKLWMSEWTEMKNGKDTGMSSAMVLAQTIYEDMTILRANSWQLWVAVSKYDYRDGLIYVTGYDETIEVTKKLYAMGQFSKFIRPGFYQNEVEGKVKLVDMMSFVHPDGDEMMVVLINRDDDPKDIQIGLEGGYTKTYVATTDVDHDLATTYEGAFTDRVHLTPESITTVVFSK